MICNQVLEPLIGGCDPSATGNQALAIIMARLFRTFMILGGLAMLLFMVWGGISWIIAGTDKGKAEEARTRITNAVIGMAFLVATAAIALFLSGVFGFDLLNPTLPGTTP